VLEASGLMVRLLLLAQSFAISITVLFKVEMLPNVLDTSTAIPKSLSLGSSNSIDCQFFNISTPHVVSVYCHSFACTRRL
jgi:hypothetical protein